MGYDKLEQWTAHVGSHKATWKAIPAGTNVTHTFVIKPKRATEKSDPYYSYPAVATYAASIEGERLTAYSNDVGAFHIYQRGELSKKAKNSLTSWVLVFFGVSVTTVLPLAVWRYQTKNYPNGLKKK